MRTLRGHQARVGALAWNGTQLATGSRDNNIMMHDVRIREHCTATLTSHSQAGAYTRSLLSSTSAILVTPQSFTQRIPQNVLTLSRKVDECKPPLAGGVRAEVVTRRQPAGVRRQRQPAAHLVGPGGLCLPLHLHDLDPHFLICIAAYDVASIIGLANYVRHVIIQFLRHSFLELNCSL